MSATKTTDTAPRAPAAPPLAERVALYIAFLARQCKVCPRRGASCGRCACEPAPALDAELRAASGAPRGRAFERERPARDLRHDRHEAAMRRRRLLEAMPADRFAAAGELPCETTQMTRNADFRALQSAGLIEVRRINARRHSYRRVPAVDHETHETHEGR